MKMKTSRRESISQLSSKRQALSQQVNRVGGELWRLESRKGDLDKALKVDEATLNTRLKTARYWARRVANWFNLNGFLILKSSDNSYHVIFNREVTWSENMKIVAWVSLLSHIESLKRWFIMQCIKEDSTLRVSPKGEKPSPRIVYREGRQDEQIREFLRYRKVIKTIMRRLN